MRDFELPGRSAVHAANGMAATPHPLATRTAIDVLQAGGNAMDAALAANAVLGVVEPAMTGVGGDCVILYAPKGGADITAFMGIGRAPQAATLEWYKQKGINHAPTLSPHMVAVPGRARSCSGVGFSCLARALIFCMTVSGRRSKRRARASA